jgi:hypothetical protein
MGAYHGTTFAVTEGRLEKLRAILEKVEKDVFAEGAKKKHEALKKQYRKDLCTLLVDWDEQPPPDSFYTSEEYPISVMDDLVIFFSSYFGRF